MESIKLALGWTPNINHIGFLVALEKHFYRNAAVAVEVLNPASDNYQTTPAKKAEMGLADFALCPIESVISYQTKKQAFPLIAVAAINKTNVSAIAVLEKNGIQHPKELDGKRYASYQARYEDHIVKAMIQNDGGQGNIEISYPDKLDIWETLLKGNADATWIFSNWEGIQAQSDGIALRQFRMKYFDIPYAYSPVIAGNQAQIEKRKEAYQNFMEASKKGFQWAAAHPDESVAILQKWIPKSDASIDLSQSLELSVQHWGNLNE